MNKKNLNNLGAHVLVKALEKFTNNNLVIADMGLLENGFYVDFKSEQAISINDFPKIEKNIKGVISSGDKVEILNTIQNLNKYQKYIIENEKEVGFIKIGKYEAISRFPLADKVNSIKAFKLINVGGSYWLNDAKNDQLTRISGICFENEKELKEWEAFVEEQKMRDHRKIGQDMEIFTFNNEIGQGLPIWLPNGQIIKNEIKKFLWDTFTAENFMFVDTPILGSKELYVRSGHWDHYKENNFPPITVENETFMLRPMTCPHHINIFNNKPHSYKELPICICEDSKLHRYESSGGLIGLERVRAMELFDCHIVTDYKNINSVIEKLDSILKKVHKKLELKIDRVDLSLHDPNDKEKYHNDQKMWKESENQLRSILKELKYNATEMVGEAAFYGPKIDYQIKTNLGKFITISTIQLDFLLPERFNMEYIDENGEKQRPVLIHFGVIGTYERFIATLLSQTKGILPLWLTPVQSVIIPINNKYHLEYSKKIFKTLKDNKIRVRLDDSNERLNKKIRESQTSKIPFQIIIGDKERDENLITFRRYGEENSTTVSIEEFISMFK